MPSRSRRADPVDAPADPLAPAMRYLNAYPDSLRERARALLAERRAGDHVMRRYPGQHAVQSDKALYAYTDDLRQTYMRTAPLLNKVHYDAKLDVIAHALGLHTRVSRVQGGRLVAKKEIRIASMFRELPEPFLRMIVVHELAHLREMEHDKAFYRLCESMLPNYHQIEFDLRLLLAHRALPAA